MGKNYSKKTHRHHDKFHLKKPAVTTPNVVHVGKFIITNKLENSLGRGKDLSRKVRRYFIKVFTEFFAKNLIGFYTKFKNLCKHKDPKVVIPYMESDIAKEMIGKKRHLKHSLIEDGFINDDFKNISLRYLITVRLKPLRDLILKRFLALYQNENNLCNCWVLVDISDSLGNIGDTSKTKHLIERLCSK